MSQERPLEQAQVSWRGEETPYAADFDDIYYHPQQGAEESRHVFLRGIGAPDCWAEGEFFTIGETGFGTGLNFLLTWQLWQQSAASSARLQFVSVEGYPLCREDLQRALSPFAELTSLADQLVAQWPPAVEGVHRLHLDGGRVTLTLLFGQAETMLPLLDATVDAWYLDGFAPDRNPQMWCPAVYQQLARLARPGAALATFTVAGHVKRGLTEVGFDVAKAKGFDRKRECLRGQRLESPSPVHSPHLPWFERTTSRYSGNQPVAIIGGGIAGTSAAHALRRHGVEVTLFERHGAPGAEASGNPCGLFNPRLTAGRSLDGRFHAQAYFYALNCYQELARTAPEIMAAEQGIFHMAEDAAEWQKMQWMAEQARWPAEHLTLWDAERASRELNIQAPQGGFWHARAGSVFPARVCQALMAETPAHWNCTVQTLQQSTAGWLLQTSDGEHGPFAAVILATGAHGQSLLDETTLPLQAVRGQLSLIDAHPDALPALVFGGYLTPAFEDSTGALKQVLGSTYMPWSDPGDTRWQTVKSEGHTRVWQQLHEALPELAKAWDRPPQQGRAALRAAVRDHLPLLGPLSTTEAMAQFFQQNNRRRSRQEQPPAPPYTPGLYTLGGLGSRGMMTAPLLAEALASWITAAPSPLPADILDALHPARVQIRQLKRGDTR
uniref:tRNA 5-methylaminomethyl-2-thiouridine biosynthesis bifunctional protein MnmC n=1 Tax=Magnetococcus massalia (strain MO-1) TaxID=451514 RepID=A0A1S7LI69_MAGMO|nr:Putative tRNA 5-methylaminomethyl-2-thiouridine biosynthesis bifunctional protein mnmC [Includes: tRNA (mnm(5)s(2)U34)-methyltransferase; FAD-dependent cmnm(5) s(2)U34 oxidoreductase] [mnmC] [Candidatus Magnetococcus massalia]